MHVNVADTEGALEPVQVRGDEGVLGSATLGAGRGEQRGLEDVLAGLPKRSSERGSGKRPRVGPSPHVLPKSGGFV